MRARRGGGEREGLAKLAKNGLVHETNARRGIRGMDITGANIATSGAHHGASSYAEHLYVFCET